MPFELDSIVEGIIDAWYTNTTDEDDSFMEALSEITLDSSTLISEGDEDEV